MSATQSHSRSTACRLYVLVATHTPTALIVRRGPSHWWHLIRWDLARLTLDPGAWFAGTLYPRRSDVSPDGRLFGYFARHNRPAPWDTYFAVAKIPWLTALSAWHTMGTWTGGCQFAPDDHLTITGSVENAPFAGHYPSATVRGMVTDWVGRDLQNEYKRGWTDVADESAVVDQLLNLSSVHITRIIRRSHPGRLEAALLLVHAGVDFRRPGIEGVQVHYVREERRGRFVPLANVVWADWDAEGRMLFATRDGGIGVSEWQDSAWTTIWSHDLSDLTPAPIDAPAWAQRW